ncbi:MAG: hypothetical protein HKO65_02845 [Gemmatimonadetes bacterium]|nr:hypothetical protein [Gemmatimonadota bacterium]NNM04015.1 hypothetical protein [Gemmatimonadota bacterium]
MKPRTNSLLLFVALLAPSTICAQSFGLGARAGTLGFGAEAAVSFSENFAVRGGLGSFFYEYDDEYDGVDYTISPPSMTGTLGIDVYPLGGSFRLMAGIMFRDGDFEAQSGDLAQAGSVEIGDTEYTEGGTLLGIISTKSTSPFLGLGFGNHTQGGFGFFIDFGVAFVGEANVSITADGEIASAPGIQQELAKEAQNIEDETGGYLKYWPILNLGLKIPFK